MNPFESFIAYAPRGGGLLCAVAYFEDGDAVAGWFTGLKDYAYPATFFRIENFFSTGDKSFLATEGSDVYGGWRYDYGKSRPVLDAALRVDDALCHRLERLQDAFASEWLRFRGDPAYAADAALYAAEDLPAGDVLVRHPRLGRFDREHPVWTHFSHDFNDEVLAYLAPRWPLDYGTD